MIHTQLTLFSHQNTLPKSPYPPVPRDKASLSAKLVTTDFSDSVTFSSASSSKFLPFWRVIKRLRARVVLLRERERKKELLHPSSGESSHTLYMHDLV